jgi:uncharacterized membrane protein
MADKKKNSDSKKQTVAEKKTRQKEAAKIVAELKKAQIKNAQKNAQKMAAANKINKNQNPNMKKIEVKINLNKLFSRSLIYIIIAVLFLPSILGFFGLSTLRWLMMFVTKKLKALMFTARSCA